MSKSKKGSKKILCCGKELVPFKDVLYVNCVEIDCSKSDYWFECKKCETVYRKDEIKEYLKWGTLVEKDPSFYLTRVHNVRPHVKNGLQYFRFKCEDPDCKGHDMKSSDIDNRELKEGDRILLGRHSQERLKYPYLVGIIG